MDQIVRKALRFDRFVLDLMRGSLLASGQEIDLRPKTFQVLTHLALNAGRLVPKHELIEAVWPDVTVTDESLVQCIRELRQKLGDDDHRLIRTLPRRGYLLDASLAHCDDQPLPPKRPGFLQELLALARRLRPPSGVLSRLRAGKRRIWMSTGSLACVLLGAAYLLLQTPAPTAVRGHVLAHLPPVSELFTEGEAKRVAAIAASKELPLPAFQIFKPAQDVPESVRRFIGIWVSDTGWVNSNRHLMLIVTYVDRDGAAEGYVVDGPPQPGSYVQSTASAKPFKAQISGRSLLYGTAKRQRSASLTMENRIEFKLSRQDGTSGVVSLDPVWILVDAERVAERVHPLTDVGGKEQSALQSPGERVSPKP
jgi:DNA-binding winged helix-turn-helix (wHTH) protein